MKIKYEIDNEIIDNNFSKCYICERFTRCQSTGNNDITDYSYDLCSEHFDIIKELNIEMKRLCDNIKGKFNIVRDVVCVAKIKFSKDNNGEIICTTKIKFN